MYTLIAVHVHFKRFVDLTINRPFAASHSRGTKPPYWRAKVALGQDKQMAYIILNGNFLCLSCASATFALVQRFCTT